MSTSEDIDCSGRVDVERIAARIRADGFVFEDARTILDHAGSGPEWDQFSQAWNRLPLDRYLRPGHHFRRRRYSRFRSTTDGELRQRSHSPYFQTLETNAYAGGIQRHYSIIEPEVRHSRLFTRLVDLDRVIVSHALSQFGEWNIDVHMFRIESAHGEPVSPTPEGIHRDGNAAFAVHLIDYRCRGGITTLYRGTDAVARRTMVERAETLIVDDERMRHYVSEITSAPGQSRATRDVMIVDFDR